MIPDSLLEKLFLTLEATTWVTIAIGIVWFNIYLFMRRQKTIFIIRSIVEISLFFVLGFSLVLTFQNHGSQVFIIAVFITLIPLIYYLSYTYKKANFPKIYDKTFILFWFLTWIVQSIYPVTVIFWDEAVNFAYPNQLESSEKALEIMIDTQKAILLEHSREIVQEEELINSLKTNDSAALKEFANSKSETLDIDIVALKGPNTALVDNVNSISIASILGSSTDTLEENKPIIGPWANSPLNILLTKRIVDEEQNYIGELTLGKNIDQNFVDDLTNITSTEAQIVDKNGVYYKSKGVSEILPRINYSELRKSEDEIVRTGAGAKLIFIHSVQIESQDSSSSRVIFFVEVTPFETITTNFLILQIVLSLVFLVIITRQLQSIPGDPSKRHEHKK